jgi:hypothetical protein
VADTVELTAGWIVAGLVTVAGVLLAHRQSEKSRQRQEDRVTIYEPVHRELESVLSRGRRLLDHGYSVWAPSSEFSDLINRGAVVPKRHDQMRADVTELLRLQESHARTWADLYNERDRAIRLKWEETDLEDEKGNRSKLADLLGHNFSDDQFNQALSSLDKESWIQQLNDRVTGQGGNRGLKLSLVTSAEELFDEITEVLAPARTAYLEGGEALLKQVEHVKSRLEKALKNERTYQTMNGPG